MAAMTCRVEVAVVHGVEAAVTRWVVVVVTHGILEVQTEVIPLIEVIVGPIEGLIVILVMSGDKIIRYSMPTELTDDWDPQHN